MLPNAWVSVSQVGPNVWNPNRMDEFMYAKELASIRKFGLVNPLIVRSMDGRYEIIDGEHRLRAAIELGIDAVPIWDLGVIDDVTAKELTIVLNETRGVADRDKLSNLLGDLLSSETTQELLDVLPFTKSDFEAVLGSSNFNWADIEPRESQYRNDSRLGWVERTFRMPAEAAEVLDQAVRRAQANEKDIPDWKALELIAADYLGGA